MAPTSINTIIAALPVYAGRAVVFRTSIHGTPKVEAPGNWDPILSGETGAFAHRTSPARRQSQHHPPPPTGSRACVTASIAGPMACATTHIDTHNYKYVLPQARSLHGGAGIGRACCARILIESICRGDWSEIRRRESDANAEEARLTEIDRRRKQLALAYELADNATSTSA